MRIARSIGLLLASVALAPGNVARAAEPTPYPFAMCSNGNIVTNPAYSAKMLDAGARVCRVDVTFAEVRPKPGDDPSNWNWAKLDALVKLRNQHPELQFDILLGYGADWANDPAFVSGANGDPAQRGVRSMPAWSAANLYGNYVFEVVRRYKKYFHVWESWNEPDLPGHAFFRGDGRTFLPYQRACWLAAKHADPKCTVLFAAMCFASVEGYLALHGLQAPSPSPPRSCFFEEYLQSCAEDPEAKRSHF